MENENSKGHARSASTASTNSIRRPLPTPQTKPSALTVADEPLASTSSVSNSPPKPITQTSSAVASSSISTASFYGSQPPALPSRPSGVGSSHTTVWQPEDRLPSYAASISNHDYREPELVEEEMPELLPADPVSSWDTGSGWGGGSSWDTGAGWDSATGYNSWSSKSLVQIDGRDLHEEESWWDPNRNKDNRPGPGILPPLLSDILHNPDHNLYSLAFTMPEFPPPPASPPSSQSASSNSSTTAPPQDAPSFEEVCASVPHPDAYYCPTDNGWVILKWGYADQPPPLARSFEMSSHHPLPRPIRRNPENCSDSTGNVTHHFHRYEKAVDAHKLDVPFHFDKWDTIETVKHKRRVGAVLPDLDLEKIALEDEDKMDIDEPEGPLLDLYVCCQCTCYLLRSPLMSGVIPRPLWDDFVKEKSNNPQPGKTPERSVAMAMETMLMAIQNKLWKGESRMLRVTREGFQRKIGWSPTIEKVFLALGFSSDTFDTESGVRPPQTDVNQPQGKQNRVRLMRAWAEIGAWVANYERIHSSLVQHENKGFKLWVSLENVRERYQLGIGGHPDQIPRNSELGLENRSALEKRYKEWRSLGMTPITYTPELLTFAYLAQCRCDPERTVEYFSNMRQLVLTLEHLGMASESVLLIQLLEAEQERGRFSYEDIDAAAATLGFGAEGPLKVEYGSDVPDEFVENAWKECVKRSWRDYSGGGKLQTDATKALKILADQRGSRTLQRVWENGKRGIMSPERAYDTLEVPKDVDEEMLITVFTMRLEESTPLQLERMREAMSVIAEVRESERLRKFLELGHDPGVIVPPTRQDLPRGLNQLGNTCYLNSLLQYFYTIRDLRAAVTPMDGMDFKSFEDDKLSDDDLKRHRVGGRLVTRREIIRSKKFITLLASLFWELEYCEDPAVTPAIELAKLALVTSKDEEEDEDKGGTDSSNDTDATLVEDGPARPAVSSPTQETAMEVDNPRAEATTRSTSPSRSGEASSSKIPAGDASVTKKAPPLTTRKATEVSNSTMMFGKQHDVAECMDNCMFQIETALLKFDAMSGNDNKTSVVKRLFYGRIRQRLASADLQSRSSIHEKEDLFSHLPVNVADDGIDIYDGLSRYFDDVVEFEGKDARMEVSLVETPPLLQIQLQRVQFNRDTLQPYKSQAYVKFWETIYMDRFLDSADPQKKARSKEIQAELTKCRERIRALLTTKRGPVTTILDHTHRFLSKQERTADVDEELLKNLRTEQEHIGNEIDRLRLRIDELKESLEDLWRDCTDAPYELTSVFIHRGSSPSFGHYFFYSRHLPNDPDSWFKYNDSDVSVISKNEVLADTTGSTANPYLLVFARKGSEVVETVKRFDIAHLTPIS